MNGIEYKTFKKISIYSTCDKMVCPQGSTGGTEPVETDTKRFIARNWLS